MSHRIRLHVLALVVAACSREPDAPSVVVPHAEPIARVELAVVPASPWRAPRGRAIAMPANAEAWSFRGGNLELVAGTEAPDGAPKLRITGAQSASLTIPGPVELGKFAALGVRVFGSRSAVRELRVIATLRGRAWPASTTEPAAEGEGWCYWRVALATEALAAAHVDALTLELEGELASGPLLDAPILEWGPPNEWRAALAKGASEPFGLALGDEWRRARYLPPGSVARGAIPPQTSGARLVFGFGSPSASRGNPGRATLRVKLGDAESRHELAKADQWFDVQLEVHASASPTPLEIELELEKQGWLAAALDEPQVFAPHSSAPTVLLITSDTHRGDHLGLARQGVELETPALDALAARGVFFSNCFSTANVTLPSHVALLTGTHPRDTGVTDNNTELADAAPTLAEAFRAAGYHTVALTSLNLLAAGFAGIGQGFDRMSWPEKRRSASETIALAREWIEAADGRPLFAWVHVFDAHTPYEPPPELARKYYDAKKDPFDPRLEPEEEWRPPAWLDGVHDPEYLRALYKSEITAQDLALGELLALPRVASGVVAFTGDHGEVLGLHGIWWEHKGVYPDTLHVPLIVSGPGVKTARTDERVMNSDLGRTLLDLAGLKSTEFPGRDLLESLARGDLDEWPRFGLAGHRQSASIDFEGWHLILHLDELAEGRRTGRAKHQVELFDVARDPTCAHDLVDERLDKARELRKHLVRWLGEWNGGKWAGTVHTDAATVRELAQLGYASADGSRATELLIDPQCSCEWCSRLR